MWDEARQARLDELRGKEGEAALTAAEEQELAELYAKLDSEETDRLRPTMERMEEELAELQQHRPQLAALVEKRRQLLTHMQSQIAEWVDEHERLKRDEALLVLA